MALPNPTPTLHVLEGGKGRSQDDSWQLRMETAALRRDVLDAVKRMRPLARSLEMAAYEVGPAALSRVLGIQRELSRLETQMTPQDAA
jgi:hypothetical protein